MKEYLVNVGMVSLTEKQIEVLSRKTGVKVTDEVSLRAAAVKAITDGVTEEANNPSDHPDYCYVLLKFSKEIGIVRWGEAGYYRTNYPQNYSQDVVGEINEKMGISPKQANAMMICSMNKNLAGDLDGWKAQYDKLLKE